MIARKNLGLGVVFGLTLLAASPSSAVAEGPLAAPAAAPYVATSTTIMTTTSELSLPELVRSVEARFPAILAAFQDRRVAEADRTSADGGFDPSWRTTGTVIPLGGYPAQRVDTLVEQPLPFWGTSVFAGYRIGLGDYPSYDGKLETNRYGEVRVGARVNLWRDGPFDRRRANIERAERGIDVAARSFDQQRIDAVRLASFRYWDWVAAGKRLALARDWLDLALVRDAGLLRRVETGDVPAFEQQENQRVILQRRAQAVTAKRALEQAAIELSLFLRTESGAPVLPEPSRLPVKIVDPTPLSPARVEADERAALEKRPELERLEAQKKQAEVERRWAANQRRPAIDVLVVGSQDIGPGDSKRAKPVLEATIAVDIPILTRVATGRERAASAQMARIDAQARLQRDRILADVRDAASALVAAEERVVIAGSELDVARALSRQELKRFDLGEGTLLLVNLREQAALEAALRQIDALADWQKARAAYHAATAGADTAIR